MAQVKKKFDGKSAMEQFADHVMTALEESEKDKKLAWVKPWRTIDSTYRNAFSKHAYSGLHNVLTCALSKFDDPRYMTFNQIRQAKGKLLKDSKATYLLAWNFSKKKDEKTGEEKVIPFAKKVVIFNAEQTEGLNLPEINQDIMDESMVADEQVLEMFEKLKIKFNHKKSNSAHYNSLDDSITVPLVNQYKEKDEWSATCLHEMIHWTAKRVSRDCDKYHFDVEARAMEELVAELGAMFLSMKLKINGKSEENSIAYISHWKKAANGNNGKKFVYKACRLAEEACKYILTTCGMVEEKVEETTEAA